MTGRLARLSALFGVVALTAALLAAPATAETFGGLLDDPEPVATPAPLAIPTATALLAA